MASRVHDGFAAISLFYSASERHGLRLLFVSRNVTLFLLVSHKQAINSQLGRRHLLPSFCMRQIWGIGWQLCVLTSYRLVARILADPCSPRCVGVFHDCDSSWIVYIDECSSDTIDSVTYFQGMLTRLLSGSKCKILVDGVFFYGTSPDELLQTLDGIFTPLKRCRLFATAHVFSFFFCPLFLVRKSLVLGLGAARS